MDDALVSVRMKYVEDLEDILQCPVCWELPLGSILTCLKGHHICETCRNKAKMIVCPSCASHFNGSRNYLAESLSAKFDEIKFSILNPNHYINRKLHKNKKCISTQTISQMVSTETQTRTNNTSAFSQTNFSETSVHIQTDFNGINIETQTEDQNVQQNSSALIDTKSETDNLPTVQKEAVKNFEIPCLMNACDEKYANDQMITHIEGNHKNNLMEITSENSLFTRKWTLLYETNKSFDYAINILDMGLFFFNICINEDGDLFAKIQVINNNYTEYDQFYYIILITNVQNALLSEVSRGMVPFCLTTGTEANNNGIFISKSNFLRYLLKENKSFVCSLTLYRPKDS